MTWLQRYRVRHYVSNAVWIAPLVAILAAIATSRLLAEIESAMGWQSELNVSSTQTFLATLAASMFTLVVFVSSALLVAVQLASSQLTPRIIGIVFRNLVMKASLTIFVFAFTFTLAVLVRITTSVPLLSSYAAAYGSLASLVVFLFLLDHVGKVLRPSGAVWIVGALGRDVIRNVYPRRLDAAGTEPTAPTAGRKPSFDVTSPWDGVVLAFDTAGLVTLARGAGCVIELVPQVGDFIAKGDPLFRTYEGGEKLAAGDLSQAVAVGQERTMQQDPAFAFRILVDIASKGLSPAINDPTTAVLALDQIHHLLREVGRRCLDDERVRDRDGSIRLIYRTPDWEDFVKLAVTEIRHFGATSIQIARRMRAMLENLIRVLPPERGVLLREELKLLQRSAERCFTEPEDQALAKVSDLQGVGGNDARAEAAPP